LHTSRRRSGKLNAAREAPQRQQTKEWDISGVYIRRQAFWHLSLTINRRYSRKKSARTMGMQQLGYV
jgi:hypothetical protein